MSDLIGEKEPARPKLVSFLLAAVLSSDYDAFENAILQVFGRRIQIRVMPSYQKGFFFRWSIMQSYDLFEIPQLEEPEMSALINRFVGSFAIVELCRSFEGSVLINLNDAANGYGLGFCDNQKYEDLIPDSEFIISRGHALARATFKDPKPWSSRKDQAFWRGSTTGHQSGQILDLPRIKLCLLSKDYPDRIDAKITNICQVDTQESYNAIVDAGVLGAHVSWEHLDEYRYHIDIDGNSSSWTGLFYKLLSGGLVLKVNSPHDFRQWFYDELKPWKHFVPVRSNLEDLIDIFDFLKRNEIASSRIANEGRELALSLDFESQMARASETVRRYAMSH